MGWTKQDHLTCDQHSVPLPAALTLPQCVCVLPTSHLQEWEQLAAKRHCHPSGSLEEQAAGGGSPLGSLVLSWIMDTTSPAGRGLLSISAGTREIGAFIKY